jgi:regulator of sigma E protease
VWQRFLIVLAGPIANFLLAILIFAGFFMTFGAPHTSNEIAVIQKDSPAEQAGIRVGDRIVGIAGQEVDRFEDIRRIVTLRPGERVSVAVERGGVVETLQVHLGSHHEQDRFGQRFRVGLLGVGQTRLELKRPSALQLIPEATRFTIDLTRAMVEGVGQIITGRRSVDELGGPMKMAQIAGQQASLGPFAFIQLIALFSINLGFINLLPVPMLDGGHLLFYTIEGVRRRPLSERAQEWAFRGGLAALLALLLFTSLNDLASFGLWDRLGRLIG